MVKLVFGCGDCGTILTETESVDDEGPTAVLVCGHCGETWERHPDGELVRRRFRVGARSG